MSDQWFYRIYGHEFGPVSLDLVRTLVATGTIAPDDEVRDATRSNWILACAASELRDSRIPRSLVEGSDRRATRDEWFCRGATGDYGPLKLADLIRLAAAGELSPDEEIKATVDDYWRQVRSYRRLIDLLPFPEVHGSFAAPLRPALGDEYCRPWTSGGDNRSSDLSRALTEIESNMDDEPYVIPFPSVTSESSQTDASATDRDDHAIDANIDLPVEQSVVRFDGEALRFGGPSSQLADLNSSRPSHDQLAPSASTIDLRSFSSKDPSDAVNPYAASWTDDVGDDCDQRPKSRSHFWADVSSVTVSALLTFGLVVLFWIAVG